MSDLILALFLIFLIFAGGFLSAIITFDEFYSEKQLEFEQCLETSEQFRENYQICKVYSDPEDLFGCRTKMYKLSCEEN